MRGYETNIRVHYLPAFGPMRLSDVSIEAVQMFLNGKTIEGKAVQTIKNLKWGLSSIFAGAMKYGYMSSNPVKGTELPPEPIRERKEFPTFAELSLLIEHLQEPISTAVWLVAVSSVRPNELAFKWKDLDAERRMLWVVRAVNRGKLHTPKYHRANRPLRLTEADVQRLLDLKSRMKATDDDWVFPEHSQDGTSSTRRYSGPTHSTNCKGAWAAAHYLAVDTTLGSDSYDRSGRTHQSCAGTFRAFSSRRSSQPLCPCPRGFGRDCCGCTKYASNWETFVG